MQDAHLFKDAQKAHKRGQLVKAQKLYERVLKINKKHAQAAIFLAIILQAQGDITKALELGKQAYENAKSDPLILINYSVILKNSKKVDDAIEVLERVLSAHPDSVLAKNSLATCYLTQNKLDLAEEMYLSLIDKVNDVGPILNLCRIEIQRGNIEQAKEYLREADTKDPGHVDIPKLKAHITKADYDDGEAFSFAIEALNKNIMSLDTWSILRSIDPVHLRRQDLESVFVKVLSNPNCNAAILSACVDLSRKNLIWKHLPDLEAKLSAALEDDQQIQATSQDGFTLLGSNISQKAHKKLSEKIWSSISYKPINYDAISTDASMSDKINIGFLSSDLRNHAIGFLTVGMFEHLHHEKFNWVIYSSETTDESEVRDRIKSNIKNFRNVSKLNDLELAKLIKRDSIDVLIDLNQWTAETRCKVFQFRPAPVQVQWLGMPGTLGAGNDCDYIIGDKWTIFHQNRNGFSEFPIILDCCYQPNDHNPVVLENIEPRSAHSLPSDAFVFCSFNQHYKFSPDTFECWIDILKRVPKSVLWLMAPNDLVKQQLLGRFSDYGISANRLVFAKHTSQTNHLKRLSHADLILDTWPYNAHTTCSDALRVGVPVITLPGLTFASRVAASILDHGDLSEWIAKDAIDYVDKAVNYATRKREEIIKIKSSVYKKYWSSQMVDSKAFATRLEHLCTSLKTRYEQGKPPRTLVVKNGGLDISEINEADYFSSITDADEPDNVEIIKSKTESTSVNNTVDYEEYSIPTDAFFKTLLQDSHSVQLIDLGAAGTDSWFYQDVADQDMYKVLGFEANKESFSEIEHHENVKIMNLAIGDGEEHTFHVTAHPFMSSFMQPRFDVMEYLGKMSENSVILERQKYKTVKLDEIDKGGDCRYIKLDLQGFELTVLQNALETLSTTLVLDIEMAAVPIYNTAPDMFEVGAWLRDQGFILHTAIAQIQSINPCSEDITIADGMIYKHVNAIDGMFVRDPLQWSKLSNDELVILAYFAHVKGGSYDLAVRALETADLRDSANRFLRYKSYLEWNQLCFFDGGVN